MWGLLLYTIAMKQGMVVGLKVVYTIATSPLILMQLKITFSRIVLYPISETAQLKKNNIKTAIFNLGIFF